jgi:4-amino-4-deoxy-L-arabinose transferase-like glycosyltransferase
MQTTYKSKWKEIGTLIVIVVLGFFLRCYSLTSFPPSLNWDEVSHGYNSYSILKTGKDEWGENLPSIFRAYGDYKLPVYIYITTISIKAFGLTDFAVRFPSVLAGVGTIIATYYLTYELFRKRKLGYLSAFLVAVEPWSLFTSRGAFEANLALFFVVLGVYFFVKIIKNSKYLIFSSFFLGLSVWTYNSARGFVPILLIVMAMLYKKGLKDIFSRNIKTIIFSALVLMVFLIPMFVQLMQPSGQARYGKVSLIDNGAITQINESRRISKLSPFLNRAVNNKVTYFAKHFTVNWVSHFSFDFLFFNGGSNYQFNIPKHGIIYIINVIPMIVGFVWLIIKRSKSAILLIAWLLISPIPSSITNEAPHVLRVITMLPVPMIITAIGIYKMAEWLKNKIHVSRSITITLYIIVIFVFLENYMINYFTNYRRDYSWSWQYGYKEVVGYVRDNYNNYDKIIVTKKYGEPHEYFLYYLKYDPIKYHNDSEKITFYQSGWWWVDRFDKFYFVNDWQIKLNPDYMSSIQQSFITESKNMVDCSNVKCLLVTSPDNFPPGWKKVKTTKFLDGSVAFEMYENN